MLITQVKTKLHKASEHIEEVNVRKRSFDEEETYKEKQILTKVDHAINKKKAMINEKVEKHNAHNTRVRETSEKIKL